MVVSLIYLSIHYILNSESKPRLTSEQQAIGRKPLLPLRALRNGVVPKWFACEELLCAADEGFMGPKMGRYAARTSSPFSALETHLSRQAIKARVRLRLIAAARR